MVEKEVPPYRNLESKRRKGERASGHDCGDFFTHVRGRGIESHKKFETKKMRF